MELQTADDVDRIIYKIYSLSKSVLNSKFDFLESFLTDGH
jgi:hypothetical protein